MFSTFALLDFGAPELLIILAIVLLLFGSKKLPQLSRGIGESLKELKKASSSVIELDGEIKGQVAGVQADLTGTSEPKS